MPNAERMFDCDLVDAESLSGEMIPCGITWETLLYVQTVFIVCHNDVFTRRYGTTMDLHNPYHGMTYWWLAEFFLCRGVAQNYFTVPGIVINDGVGGALSSYTRIMQLATTKSDQIMSACEKFSLEYPPLGDVLLQNFVPDVRASAADETNQAEETGDEAAGNEGQDDNFNHEEDDDGGRADSQRGPPPRRQRGGRHGP
jgi:hypothetical protein